MIEAKLVTSNSLQGCTEEEVLQIEKKYDIKLALVYRHFLLRMGKSAGAFLQGSDFLFDKICHLRQDAEDILNDSDTNFKLSKHDFVFLVHQGYQFLFFNNLESNNDPSVFYYLEDEPVPKKVYEHFSEWLCATVRDEIQSFAELKKNQQHQED